MIDEKKLKEEIESLTVFITGLRAGKGVLSEFAKHYKESVLRIIDEQPQADKWIPCEERLPENNTNVIACFSSGTVTELTYLGNGFFQGIYEYNTKVIVAWQPLPQPYKKEGAENE